MLRTLIVLASLALAQPAFAQWTRVTEVPASVFSSVHVQGDTILAGADTAAFVSTNGGVIWQGTRKVTPAVTSVSAVRVRNGRLYAGTQGQGVFVSDNLGQTWTAFNQGLVGGIGNSQLFIVDLLLRGDSLYAATSGAGPWVRNLVSGSWTRFGNALEVNQSSNMNAITAGGSRLFACGGFNGTAFFRDPAQSDWTLTLLENDHFVPGLAALTAIRSAGGWVVGSNTGVYISAAGQSPWTQVDIGVPSPLLTVAFARRGNELFASFGNGGSTIEWSGDDGASWNLLEDLPGIFTLEMAVSGNTLYAARLDGLWRRSVVTVSVPPLPADLRFALSGAHPVRETARLAFELPRAGRVLIEIFDVAGRRVATALDAPMSAGPHLISWDAGGLAPGVYLARLEFEQQWKALRIVRMR